MKYSIDKLNGAVVHAGDHYRASVTAYAFGHAQEELLFQTISDACDYVAYAVYGVGEGINYEPVHHDDVA